ncbi:DNA polymerase III subunit gamma/tau [Thermosipho ferrireducens]|uniref:DNA polymerase III subunit gamma/tau n=1 Tax=Thermosipho ferrireducens TaxID=2571116 RepID=A0ABX7S4L6_9BACT|nr:DNA polymerase III subunit gamma/tau [Thermosipho ferrireducens]QTA37399.1 DNA polymerase III subunit gamma/tau [Thermosipho ferrireducens]
METLYRKYRPKRFSEVVGQTHVKTLFSHALTQNRLAHAYIFAGPRGTGKTTVARILAKALNCENRKDYEPCNECFSCKAIDNGNFIDVIEIDAASNRGIDEIRKIREAVGYHPVHGKYKVYIIDEVHMLTKEAFNALLKTLEEPPENVVFVLATTNPEKVPLTILSRCQVIDFRNIDIKNIIERLKYVSEIENLDISIDALNEIAKRANGGLRDALTILEQVVRFSEGSISSSTVKEVLGMVPDEIIEEFISNILSGKVQDLLKQIDDIYSSGKDIEVFFQQTLNYLVENIEKGEIKYIQLLKPLSEIAKDIKYVNEKLLIAKIGIVNVSHKYIESYSKNNFQKNQTKSEEMQFTHPDNNDEKAQTTFETEKITSESTEELTQKMQSAFSEIMEELKLYGDLSLYVGLSLADVVEKQNEITISFTPDKKIHYELIKSKKEELEKMYATKSGILKPISIKIGKDIDTDVLDKLKSIFGDDFVVEE